MTDEFLLGRAALVTGGASGIGRAIALRLARAGADLAILSLSRDRVALLPGELKYFATRGELGETQAAVESCGRRCLTFEGDVSSGDDVAGAVQSASRAFGRLDILVNNAVLAPTPLPNMASWA